MSLMVLNDSFYFSKLNLELETSVYLSIHYKRLYIPFKINIHTVKREDLAFSCSTAWPFTTCLRFTKIHIFCTEIVYTITKCIRIKVVLDCFFDLLFKKISSVTTFIWHGRVILQLVKFFVRYLTWSQI